MLFKLLVLTGFMVGCYFGDPGGSSARRARDGGLAAAARARGQREVKGRVVVLLVEPLRL